MQNSFILIVNFLLIHVFCVRSFQPVYNNGDMYNISHDISANRHRRQYSADGDRARRLHVSLIGWMLFFRVAELSVLLRACWFAYCVCVQMSSHWLIWSAREISLNSKTFSSSLLMRTAHGFTLQRLTCIFTLIMTHLLTCLRCFIIAQSFYFYSPSPLLNLM